MLEDFYKKYVVRKILSSRLRNCYEQTMKKALLLILSALLFCACGDDSTSADVGPSPDVVEADAGPAEIDGGFGTDSGPVEIDGGPAEIDGGPVEIDGGPVEIDGGPVETDAGPAPADAGPLCLFNSECPDETACTGVSDSESSLRSGSPRNRGVPGLACETSEDCASAVCIDDFCTKLCDEPSDCSSDNLPRCNEFVGYCTPISGS